MKKLIILLGVVAIVLSSCGTGSKSLKNEQDSVAYAIGIDLGRYIMSVDSTLNVDIVAGAIKDVLKHKEVMEQEDAFNFMREVFAVRRPAREKEASEKYLQDILDNNKNAKVTESGLIYEIVSEGDLEDAAVSDSDVVRVVYHGTKRDGTVFDSSVDRGDTAQFALNRVIKGWQEGMKLVGPGGKVILWVPSDLAYGPNGAGQHIKPNEALKFEVEVVEVEHVENEVK